MAAFFFSLFMTLHHHSPKNQSPITTKELSSRREDCKYSNLQTCQEQPETQPWDGSFQSRAPCESLSKPFNASSHGIQNKVQVSWTTSQKLQSSDPRLFSHDSILGSLYWNHTEPLAVTGSITSVQLECPFCCHFHVFSGQLKSHLFWVPDRSSSTCLWWTSSL